MESVVQLWNEWEIQLVVLLSFMLQIFLFFTGLFRRRSTNMLLNLSIWIAYLGADLVAVYALGFLSRHVDAACDTLRGTHKLAFFWAPFLLIHLGGQDTITAFAIEDNNLWLRHLLNLAVQAGLALYVFWKSIAQHNFQLIAPGIFVFIAGIIKYGERTMALMYGNLKNFTGSNINENEEELSDLVRHPTSYFGIVSYVLHSAPGVRELFAGRTLHQMEDGLRKVLTSLPSDMEADQLTKVMKVLEFELDLMYDDLYTKAMVLRTRSGIVLRCISQVSLVVAFVLFLVSNMKRYSMADLVITYVLFIGGLFLEFCAMFILLMSPWCWAWLEARKCRGLTRMSAFVLSSNIGRPERRPLWSNSMGQYNFLSYVGCEQSRLSKLVQKLTRNMVRVFGGRVGKSSLSASKLLDTKYLKVDKEIMECVVRMVYRYESEGSSMDAQRWPNLGPLLTKLLPDFGASFGYGIVCFHIFTEVHLSEYPPSSMNGETGVLVSVCRKLSDYMLYLWVTHPEILPVSGTAEPTLKFFLDKITPDDRTVNGGKSFILSRASEQLRLGLDLSSMPPKCRETLEEIRDMWTKLLVYSAGKSRAEMHAAQLARGGELITFAWLLVAHRQLGDVGERYAFNLMSNVVSMVPVPRESGDRPFRQRESGSLYSWTGGRVAGAAARAPRRPRL